MLILLVLFTSRDVTSSNFRFAHHYGDHMVLQRDPYRVVIWGFGDQGTIVNVSIVNLKQQKQYKSTVKRGGCTFHLLFFGFLFLIEINIQV